MTDTSSSKASPDAPTGLGVWIGVALTYGMFAIAGLMGLLVLYAGLRLIVTGEQHWGVGLLVTAMGIIFASIGFGFYYFQYANSVTSVPAPRDSPLRTARSMCACTASGRSGWR